MRESLAKAGFFVATLPSILASAVRVTRLERELPIDELMTRLRQRRSRPLPPRLARPAWLAGTIDRLLPVLPPRRLGPCLRRALIVAELWSRCGLEVRLHLGVAPRGDLREAHAWLTAEGAGGERFAVSSPLHYAEAFVF